MKLRKSIGILGKAIGFDSIISSIITVVLIAGVIVGIFKTQNHYVWSDVIKNSKGTYEYTSYNESYTNGVDSKISKLYKDARILYGYADMDNLSLENYSSGSIMLYGWDEKNSEKLNSTMTEVLEEIEILKSRTSFKEKEKDVIGESLKMIRYFCNNQQVINKVRLAMKLTSEVSQSNSSLNITLIDDGGEEYFKGYEEKLKNLKGIFDSV